MMPRVHFILYHPPHPLADTQKSHKHEYPKLGWLIISHQQDVSAPFPTPRSGTIISRCFSNVARIKFCSRFLVSLLPPWDCWQNQLQKGHCLTGHDPPCSVTVRCETERMSLDTTESNKYQSSTTQAQLPLNPLSSISQPGATLELHSLSSPTSPNPVLFLISALGGYTAASHYLLSAGIKRNLEEKNHN